MPNAEPPASEIARAVLTRFRGVPANASLQSLDNHGGFSGANLWRIESDGHSLCLLALSPQENSPDHLAFVHQAMKHARHASLTFVPSLISTLDGGSFLRHADRLWELMDWMPGKADFHQTPSAARLANACDALARLHNAWAPAVPTLAPCPAVHRRLDRCRRWFDLLASGWRPAFSDTFDPVDDPARRAWRLLNQWAPKVAPQLASWANRSFPLHPCLCDIWHDHVLFDGDRVSGLIDYGSLKLDCVAVDLARLLGSMVGDDAAMWKVGLDAYRSVRLLPDEVENLAHALDRTGTVLALANWLIWLYYDSREFANRCEVARRLSGLVDRVESWD
jgi:Ser/Thr protein kinase RdoA (MazF antagonist)